MISSSRDFEPQKSERLSHQPKSSAEPRFRFLFGIPSQLCFSILDIPFPRKLIIMAPVKDDFILTLDSDYSSASELDTPGPSTSKRTQPKKLTKKKKDVTALPGPADEVALDEGFKFDLGEGADLGGFDGMGGGINWKGDEVTGGKLVSAICVCLDVFHRFQASSLTMDKSLALPGDIATVKRR